MTEIKTLSLVQDLTDSLQDRLNRSLDEAEGLFFSKISKLWGNSNLPIIIEELKKYSEPSGKVNYSFDEAFKKTAKNLNLDNIAHNNNDLADYIIYLMRRTYLAISLGRDHSDRFNENGLSVEDINVFITNIQVAFYLLGNLETVIYTNEISASILNKVASKGGFAKAEKYREKMSPIFEEVFNLFIQVNPKTSQRWNSKKECANYYIKDFYKKNPDTQIDLDPKKLVQEITNRLNKLAASRQVNMQVKKSLY